LKGRPNDGRLLLGIGAIQRRQGKMTEALASMTKAIEVDPRRSEYLFNAAQTYALLRDYRKAEDHIDRALSLSPDLIGGHLTRLRVLLFADGNTARARDAMKKVEQLADYESSPAAIWFKAHLEMCDGNFPEALRVVETKFKTAYNDQFLYEGRPMMLAEIHSLMKDTRKAALYYDSARVELEGRIKDDPADPRYHSALGIVLAGLGRKSEAIAEGRKAVEMMPVEKEAWRGSYRLLELAKIYTMTGEKDSAVALLGQLLAMPADVERRHLKIDPAWIPLRDHPGFVKLVSSN
jgi:serine/threonine-protein kinase